MQMFDILQPKGLLSSLRLSVLIPVLQLGFAWQLMRNEQTDVFAISQLQLWAVTSTLGALKA